jgi:hypothetical protein
MAVFSVFEPPRERPDRAERFAFVRDGFSWGAFVFGPLWMLARKLWLVFVIYLVVVVGLAFAMHALGVLDGAQIAVAVLVALLLGLEGGTLRRWTLRRRRWRDLGIVVADDLEAAERRFFDAWVAEGGVAPTRSAPPASQMAAGPASQSYATTGPDVIGLFPEPGARR